MGVMMNQPSLKELAQRISAHLKRFESDPRINQVIQRSRGSLLPQYSAARAYVNGTQGIGVIYVGYQTSSKLRRDEAEKYLAWLDAGHIGKHYAMEE